MKVLICGSRKFNDWSFFEKTCDELLTGLTDIEIVSGGATGADAFAEKYAQERNLALKVFPADWKRYGRSAGPIRNIQMLDYLDSDSTVIGFVFGESKGTRFTLKNALKRNLKTYEIQV